MADNKKMSVEDILAACRAGDGGDSSSSEPVSPAAPEAPKANPPKEKPAAPSGDMSVADILAAARGGGGSSVEKPAAAAQSGSLNTADILAAARGAAAKSAPAAGKPKVAKPATGSAKASPKQADAKPPRTGPMDTSSILAAARSGDKPGPMSKAEAAAKSKGPAGGKAKPVLPPMPEKPAYAVAAPKPAAADDNRRGFISALFGSALAIGFVSLSGTFLAWTLGTARFMFPNILIEPPSRFKVGFPSDFAAGTVATQFKAQFGVSWLFRHWR